MASTAEPLLETPADLGALATEIYPIGAVDLTLGSFLGRLIARSAELLDTPAGSISLVDPLRERYRKVAERGAKCQLGQTFPLDEGVTGRVLADRRPVVLASYAEVARGHLPDGHPAQRGAVAAVPIWWRGDVIGASVMFAGRPRRFTTEEIDGLETVTQLAAAGIVRAAQPDLSLAGLIRDHRSTDPALAGVRTVITEAGRPRPVSAPVARVAVGLVLAAERAAGARDPRARLHVAVVHRPDELRLIVHDESPDTRGPWVVPQGGSGPAAWTGLAGGPIIEHVPGWGTVLRADLPYPTERGQPSAPPARPDEPPTPAAAPPTPFTPREREVCALLAQGMTDREVAARLVIAPKTAEKHVGSLLRKTGAHSRTAAVMRALERRWIPPIGGTLGH